MPGWPGQDWGTICFSSLRTVEMWIGRAIIVYHTNVGQRGSAGSAYSFVKPQWETVRCCCGCSHYRPAMQAFAPKLSRLWGCGRLPLHLYINCLCFTIIQAFCCDSVSFRRLRGIQSSLGGMPSCDLGGQFGPKVSCTFRTSDTT